METTSPKHPLAATFESNAKRIALIDLPESVQMSYSELEESSSVLGKRLSSVGRMGTLLSNRAYTIVTYLAALQQGKLVVPINPALTVDQISQILSRGEIDTLIVDEVHRRRVPRDFKGSVFSWGQDLHLQELKNGERLHPRAFPFLNPHSVGILFFTSGTTGEPKCIPFAVDKMVGHARMFVDCHGLGPQNRFFSVLPLFYGGGWYNLTLVPLMAGGSIVVDDEFGGRNIYQFWKKVLENQINSLWFTPSMLSALLAAGLEDEVQGRRIRELIRWTMVGMAYLPPPLKADFEAQFGLRLQKSYGLSETLLFTSWKNKFDRPPESVGAVLDSYEVCVEPERQEILVRGPFVFEGYVKSEEPNPFTSDGFLKTGDTGRLEGDEVYITGRIKDIIKRAGMSISPVEIENALLKLEGIREAAVVGLEDALLGEAIHAVVTLEKQAIDPQEIKERLRELLPASHIPQKIHIRENLPLNASGKIQKHEIVKWLKQFK